MSIIYNNQVVAGKYAQQVVADADTVNAGIIKIATEEQINEGTDNTTAVTPFYLAQKQDKISAGDDIVINNNEISCTIKPDEQTIVRKNNGTMQCIGQLTKSNTLKFDWEGTQAEYNVAYLNGTIQPDWYCYITDDEQFVDYDDVCNKSLSNLRPDGEARFDAKLNLNLDNINEEGEKKLNISKMYYTNDVYTEEKGYNQLLEMRHSTFDLSKFSVVGSPTITEDGVVSGFSEDYQLKTNYVFKPDSKSWKIQGEFTTGEDITTSQWIFSNLDFGVRAVILNGAFRTVIGSTRYGQEISGANNNPYALKAKTTYFYSIEYNATTKTYTREINDNKVVQYTGDLIVYQNSSNDELNKMIIGSSLTADFMTGSIDLKQFSITVDGKEVFNGNKTGIDIIKPDNYTVVGSPVISDDGVISYGSSGGNNRVKNFVNVILQEPLPLVSGQDNKNVYKFCVNFKYSDKEQAQPLFWFYPQNTPNNRIMYLILNSASSVNGISTALFDKGYVAVSNLFTNGENYKLEYVTDLISYFSIYINGSLITTQTFVKSDINTTLNKICLAGTPDSTGGDGVSPIDLNAFKIYVDGNLVYQPCLKIPYTLSKTGSKIVDVAYRDRVIDLYEQEGQAGYYTIDEPNKNFTLPMGEIYGMIENIKNTKSGGSGLEVGDISMALYVDETKGLRRYLNGQIVDINTNTQAFLNRLLEIKNTNPDYFATEENWQSEALLNIDGCVYKFVLNYSGETVVSVRLPKYPDYVEINAGGTLPVVGNGMTLGLTDGTSNGALVQWGATTAMTNAKGALYGKNVGTTTNAQDAFATYAGIGVVSDPTKSGIQTTLNQTKLKMRYFIQIATGSETKNNIINEIELNNPFSLFDSKYSDHELNNLSWLLANGTFNGSNAVHPSAYQALLVENNAEVAIGSTVTLPNGVKYTKQGLSVKLSTETYTDYDFVLNTTEGKFRLPLLNGSEDLLSDRYDDLELLSSGSAYTAPANGWFRLVKWTTAVGQSIQFNPHELYRGRDNSDAWMYQFSSIANQTLTITLPVLKGQKTWCYYSAGGETVVFEFIYAQGNGSLYYYIGETVQNANLIDAGRIGEQLANKQDKLSRYPIEISNKSLMPSWYVVYSDGWCEQGGLTSSGTGTKTINLLKQYSSTTYNILIQPYYNTASYGDVPLIETSSKTVSSFKIQEHYAYGSNWETKGYIS